MSYPLMPKATAVWLIENTALTFNQIADFTGIHLLEIEAIANGDISSGIVGFDPLLNAQLTREEIERCEADSNASLRLLENEASIVMKKRATRYTPVAKRCDRPDAIMWLVKNHPELTVSQICKLVGTTRPTVLAIREKTHKNIQNIQPRNPVTLGLCSEANLEKAVVVAVAKKAKEETLKAEDK